MKLSYHERKIHSSSMLFKSTVKGNNHILLGLMSHLANNIHTSRKQTEELLDNFVI